MHVRQHIAKQKITNHASVSLSTGMGNVLVTISDKRLPQCSATVVTGHTAYVISATDYSAFGAPLPGRTFAGEGYRFGFNGKEMDNEVYGAGNLIDYGARVRDARIGPWLSVDPLQFKYPFVSPYNYTLNNPIFFIDPDGKVVIPGSPKTEAQIKEALKNPKFKELYDKLNNSEIKYQFNLNIKLSDGDGYTTTDGSIIIMNFSLNSGSGANADFQGELSSLFHEAKHGEQFEDGKFGFYKSNNEKWYADEFADVFDEVEAYEFGFESSGSDERIKQTFSKLSSKQKVEKWAREHTGQGKLATSYQKLIDDWKSDGKQTENKTRLDSENISKTVKTENKFFRTKGIESEKIE